MIICLNRITAYSGYSVCNLQKLENVCNKGSHALEVFWIASSSKYLPDLSQRLNHSPRWYLSLSKSFTCCKFQHETYPSKDWITNRWCCQDTHSWQHEMNLVNPQVVLLEVVDGIAPWCPPAMPPPHVPDRSTRTGDIEMICRWMPGMQSRCVPGFGMKLCMQTLDIDTSLCWKDWLTVPKFFSYGEWPEQKSSTWYSICKYVLNWCAPQLLDFVGSGPAIELQPCILVPDCYVHINITKYEIMFHQQNDCWCSHPKGKTQVEWMHTAEAYVARMECSNQCQSTSADYTLSEKNISNKMLFKFFRSPLIACRS